MKSLRKMSYLVLSVLALGVLSVPRIARSEPGGLHLNITPFGGYATWAKELNLDNKPMFGARVGLGFGRHLGVEGYYSWMKTHTESGFGDELFINTPPDPNPATDQKIQGYGADLTLNLFPSIAFNPYVLAGWHEEKIQSDAPAPNDFVSFQNGLEFGGGVKLGMGRKVALRLELRDKLWKFDSPPAPDPPGNKSLHNIFYSGGIQITFGGSAHGGDADKDGVKDSEDKCPDTPRGAQVDATGCPLDSDGDHVPDGIDQCPNTPAGATVDDRGCPSDADADGVSDGIDQCPGTPAGTTVDARGCPADSDGDGVPDGVDRCANTPAGAKVDDTGCPVDSDNDGVPDGIDQCPGTPANTKVDERGCSTDSDGDGVQDDKDLCPNTQANVKVDSDGCPIELSEKEIELLDKGRITTREIHFETAKWDILPESRPVIDEIGKILIQWPRLKIEIGGHADARGSVAYNQDLTEKRAQAVLDYLIQNFPQINKEQYTAVGYGELKPIASNKTIEGMAKNRRVEFKVLNTEELTKERERRHLMKKGE
jgi:outer membrane protein OmpA-like peptidoglycan-associated protein